jgi:hypothetical protein
MCSGLVVCAARIHICMPVVSIKYAFAHSFKGRNHVQMQSKYKVSFLDQNLILFRMVHLVFLKVESYMLNVQVESKYSFCEWFYSLSCT